MTQTPVLARHAVYHYQVHILGHSVFCIAEIWVNDMVIWPRGYKTFFMLDSAELEIYPAHKC